MTTTRQPDSAGEELQNVWDTLDDAARWVILNATDLRGLQKCNAACQPFRRLKSEWRDKLIEAYNEQIE